MQLSVEMVKHNRCISDAKWNKWKILEIDEMVEHMVAYAMKPCWNAVL